MSYRPLAGISCNMPLTAKKAGLLLVIVPLRG